MFPTEEIQKGRNWNNLFMIQWNRTVVGTGTIVPLQEVGGIGCQSDTCGCWYCIGDISILLIRRIQREGRI